MSVSQTTSARPFSGAATAFPWLTLERTLYALLVLLAAGIRLGGLGQQPLTAAEAGHAWSAWLVVNGSAPTLAPAPDSPLLYSLYSYLFWLFGGNDLAVRSVAALCGTGLVALVWYWRAWLGQTVALLAAVLLTIDPWLVANSRLADSAMLSLFLAMLTLTGLAQVAAKAEPLVPTGWDTVTAVSAGLLLVSGPQSWSLWVVLGLFGWLCLPHFALLPWLRQPRIAGLLGLAAFLGGTGWLARMEGLGAISTSLTVWLGQLTGRETNFAYGLGWLLWRMLLEQPLVLPFGLLGLGIVLRYRERIAFQLTLFNPPTYAPSKAAEKRVQPENWLRFLVAWLVWGTLLVLAPGRAPLLLPLFGLPLAFLAAYGLLFWLQQARDGVAWRENSLLVSILAILLISFTIWFSALTNNATFDTFLVRTLLIVLVLLFLIVLAYTLWLNGRQARLATGGLVIIWLFAWTMSSGWQLNHRFDVALPDGFFASYTNPDIRRLVVAVQTMSAQRHGDASEMPLQVQMTEQPDPVLGWYLRPMRNLTWVLAPGTVDGQSPPVVITLSDDSLRAQGRTGSAASALGELSSNYLGSQYALRDYWLPSNLTANDAPPPRLEGLSFGARLYAQLNTRWTTSARALLRWSIYREVPALPTGDAVVLWVQADGGQ
ncbi:MAG: hypothetical protein KF832_27525 [Caldilineaceae bacterium]|nr:hypothetical protein [Caldilineaceae bacterium]